MSITSENPPLLQATGLTVYRGDLPLFADVELSLQAGEVLQIEGSNGSGKTTLLRILCALALADEGELFWRGKKLPRYRAEYHAETLYLGHKPGIKAELTPVENLRLAWRLGQTAQLADESSGAEPGKNDLAREDAIAQALATVNLAERSDLPCAVLSAGQQRRVALARLLLNPAVLWVLDEPLTALDVEGRETVQKLLDQHIKAGGALLFTTHQALPIAGQPARSLRLGAEPREADR